MQHRYVPDLGDFSKFAVIDALSGSGVQTTALVWYLVNPYELDEAHNNDGKHTTYLSRDRQRFGECCPSLYRKMQAIHRTGEKHVAVYARHTVLPGMAYFAEPLSYDGINPVDRSAHRSAWHGRALHAAEQADLVMLDPDNGLASPDLSLGRKHAIKFATLDECAAFHGGGRRSLIVYQHGHRNGTVEQQTDRALSRLAEHLGTDRDELFALRFHRGTARCYLVVPANGQSGLLRRRAEAMVAGLWGELGHFSLIT